MKTTNLQKIALLLVSLLVISSGALLPSLPKIIAEYHQMNSTLIELLGTLPALFTMLTVLVSPRLAERIGYKRTVQLGLVIVLISGLLPIIVHSFIALFLSRVTFGIGVGLFNPLLFSFSSNLYQGPELSNMIGFQSAFEGMGGIITSLLVAQLIVYGWRQTLWVYLIIIPIFLLFTVFVPDIHPKTTVAKSNHSQKVSIDGSFVGLVALLMILITIHMSVSVKLTALLTEGGFGTAKDASVGLALVGVGAMTAGLVFGKAYQLVGKWILPISFLGLGLSLMALSLTSTIGLVMGLSFAIGLCFRTFVPYLMNLANQVLDGSSERRTALLLMGFNIGSAFAPLTIKLMQNSLHLTQVKSIFLVEGVFVCLLAVGSVIMNIKRNLL